MQPHFSLRRVLCNCVHRHTLFNVLHLRGSGDNADHCELNAVGLVPFFFFFKELLLVLFSLVVGEVWLSSAKGRGNRAG